MKVSELTNSQQRITFEIYNSILHEGKVKLESNESTADIDIAYQYIKEQTDKILNPKPLTIEFVDNFNSDELRLTHAFPLAKKALESGKLGHKVASQYFILAFNAAMRLGRYADAIVATYGMANAGERAYDYVEKLKSHQIEGANWFKPYYKQLSIERCRELDLVWFSSWYE
jgi:hypothetical protein